MDKKYKIALCITIFLIIMIIYYIYSNRKVLTNYIEGVWIADTKFLEEAELGNDGGLILYIGQGDWNERKAYILMFSDDGVVLNQKVDMTFNFNIGYSSTFMKRNVVFDDLDEVMPCNLTVEMSTIDGSMIFYDNETVYMRLYKDHQLSADMKDEDDYLDNLEGEFVIDDDE